MPPTKSSLPFSVFATDSIDPGDRWAVWRDSISVIFDVAPPPGAEAMPLAASVRAHHLGSLVFGDTAFTPQRYTRSKRKIAQDGLDHYLVQLYLEGGYAGTIGAQDVELRAGDICVLDLGQTVDTLNPASRTHSLVVPRTVLADALPGASNLHGAVLRREGGPGLLLADHLTSLRARLPDLTPAEAPVVVESTVAMVAACFRPSADSLNRAHSPITEATLHRVQRHIEEHLAAPELSPDSVAAAFRLSRATLYRLFEPLGGVAAYIQERRLAHAFADLIHPANRHRRIFDIAFDWGFNSEAHFSHAFRRAFGLTASELRALGDTAPWISAGQRPGPAVGDYADWIAHLARHPLPATGDLVPGGAASSAAGAGRTGRADADLAPSMPG